MIELKLEYFATVDQLADALNVHKETVRRWIRSGKLKATGTGKGRLKKISVTDLIEFLDMHIRDLEKDLSDCKKFRDYLNSKSDQG